MIVVDVEATGIDASIHSLLSVGAIDLENPENRFYQECRMFKGAKIMEEALKVNGFTIEQAQDITKQTDVELVKNFIKWVNATRGNKILAGQNPSFDVGMLDAVTKKAGLERIFGTNEAIFGYHSIDLHSVTQTVMRRLKKEIPPSYGGRRIPRSAMSAEFVGLPVEPFPHHALNGAKYEGEALYRLFYGKNLLKEFKQYPLPDYLLL